MKRVVHMLRNHVLSPLRSRWVAFLYLISEWESLVQRPGSKLRWRKAFLRAVGVEFRGHVFFGNGFRLYKHGSITLGKNSCFGENCGLYAHGDVKIGDDFVTAPGLTINSGDHDPLSMKPIASPIAIGDRVWCGVNVTVLAGSTIGDDCVIGANALVRGEIPPRSVAVGIPAKVVRRLERPDLIWGVYGNVQRDEESH
jgi:maltose O-acetyltransferase